MSSELTSESEGTIRTVAVLGAGTMGAGIAQVAALAGFSVRLHDPDGSALRRGLDLANARVAEGVKRGKVTEAQQTAARQSLAGATDLEGAIAAADLIVEAAPESMALKKKIFGTLAAQAPAGALLGSNTSSLSLTEIASAAGPAAPRVVGLHFFNPPHIMKLVEIVTAEQTSSASLARARRFVAALGKEAILVRDAPGFATSRLGLALGLEAMRMVETQVASAADIDRAMELGYGHAMGPLKVSDLVGLDVRLSIAEILQHELGDRFAPPAILRRLVRAGKTGRKSGEGFYRWDASGTPRPPEDSE